VVRNSLDDWVFGKCVVCPVKKHKVSKQIFVCSTSELREGNILVFQQTISDDNDVQGVLLAKGDRLVSTLRDKHGMEFGKLRLWYKDGKIISNFHEPESSWDEADDIVATRKEPDML